MSDNTTPVQDLIANLEEAQSILASLADNIREAIEIFENGDSDADELEQAYEDVTRIEFYLSELPVPEIEQLADVVVPESTREAWDRQRQFENDLAWLLFRSPLVPEEVREEATENAKEAVRARVLAAIEAPDIKIPAGSHWLAPIYLEVTAGV